MIMQDKMWITKIWPLPLSDAYNLSDSLFGEFVSNSVVQSKNDDKEWCLEIISDRKLSKADYEEFFSVKNLTSELLPDVDWLAECFRNFKPITVGKFYIYGSHSRLTNSQKHKIPLKIDAANAFGSGEHPTTRGCLTAIQRYFNAKIHRSSLDLGCGSCILGMAIAKLGGQKIYAFDNDPAAVDVSRSNVVKNNVKDSITVKVNESVEFNVRKYDFIVSNILAQPLISLSSELVNCLSEDGILVISGFTDKQRGVIDSYTNLGLSLVTEYNIDNWLTAVLCKD